jgi:hypothetical protein
MISFAVASTLVAGSASAQWSDDFNRPDGPIGGTWTVVSGSWNVIGNRGAHTSSPSGEILLHDHATLAYYDSFSRLDVFAPGSSNQNSAVLIGLGGTDAIRVKIQDQDPLVPGFSHIGLYHLNGGTWPGSGTGFGVLTAPFLSARLTVYFSDPDTVVAEIDTDFDGLADQMYSRTGVLSIAASFGTQYGITAWGSTALFDNWSVDDGSPALDPYCTAGTTSHGCVAAISADANPSLTAAHPCNVTVRGVEGQKSGLIFYGLTSIALPWCSGSSSYLCVKPPTQRTGPQSTGGTTNACDGTMALDWNAFQAANPGSLGNPWSVGTHVYVQGWFRDPPACKTTNLSDAIDLTYVP